LGIETLFVCPVATRKRGRSEWTHVHQLQRAGPQPG
jgi:hypothetical protein